MGNILKIFVFLCGAVMVTGALFNGAGRSLLPKEKSNTSASIRREKTPEKVPLHARYDMPKDDEFNTKPYGAGKNYDPFSDPEKLAKWEKFERNFKVVAKVGGSALQNRD